MTTDGIDMHIATASDIGSNPTRAPGRSEYARMGMVLDKLADEFPNQPSLAELAAHVGLSEPYFQRMFMRWVGVSPKKFLQHLTLAEAKRRLRESASVLDAAYDSGLSGPGRLHDLFVTFEAMTPGEYKARGEGLTVRYGFHDSPFGECLLMATERGICGLGFVAGDARDAPLAKLSRGWERAELLRDDAATQAFMPRIFAEPGGSVSRDARQSGCSCGAAGSSSRSGRRCSKSRRGRWPHTRILRGGSVFRAARRVRWVTPMARIPSPG